MADSHAHDRSSAWSVFVWTSAIGTEQDFALVALMF